MRTYITIAGKVYGWKPIIFIDIHLNTGTVQRSHPFFWFRQNGPNFKWKTSHMLNVKSGETIQGWFTVGVKNKFFWGIDENWWQES